MILNRSEKGKEASSNTMDDLSKEHMASLDAPMDAMSKAAGFPTSKNSLIGYISWFHHNMRDTGRYNPAYTSIYLLGMAQTLSALHPEHKDALWAAYNRFDMASQAISLLRTAMGQEGKKDA